MKKEADKAEFFRYLRPKSFVKVKIGDKVYDDLTPFNMGGTTLAIELDYKMRQISIGFSMCALDENFSKKEGRERALARLKNDPIIINLEYFTEVEGRGIVDKIVALIADNSELLTNQSLTSQLKYRMHSCYNHNISKMRWLSGAYS